MKTLTKENLWAIYKQFMFDIYVATIKLEEEE